MLSGNRLFNIRRTMQNIRAEYRPIVLVYPVITSGSNYEAFGDGQWDISADADAYASVTFTLYETRGRVRIAAQPSLMGMGPPIPGVVAGDYLVWLRLSDEAQVNRVIEEKHAYAFIDGERLRPEKAITAGLTQKDEILVHFKAYEPEHRATGL